MAKRNTKTVKTAQITFTNVAIVTVFENDNIFAGFQTHRICDAMIVLNAMGITEENITKVIK